jgi:hypothetical protein
MSLSWIVVLWILSSCLGQLSGAEIVVDEQGPPHGWCQKHQYQQRQRHGRQVWGWASFSMDLNAIAQQIYDHPTLLDGIEIICGATFHSTGIAFNETTWNECRPVIDAVIATDTKFQLWIVGPVPPTAHLNPEPFIRDAIAIRDRIEELVSTTTTLSSSFVLDGFSLDDERDCAPRATLQEFGEWMIFHNAFGQGLIEKGLALTSAVQALFAIEDQSDNLPCQYSPSSYTNEPTMTRLLANATLTKWLVMDTYYFSTGRFYGSLDWHVNNVPLPSLAIGMMNRDDLSVDDVTARFYAIDKSNVDWINMWHFPIDDIFIPFLERWKTHCDGCGVQTILGCYDMAIQCHHSSSDSSNDNTTSGLSPKSGSLKVSQA